MQAYNSSQVVFDHENRLVGCQKTFSQILSSQCAASGFSMNKLRLLLLMQFAFLRQFRILPVLPDDQDFAFPIFKGDLCHSHYALHMKLYCFQGLEQIGTCFKGWVAPWENFQNLFLVQNIEDRSISSICAFDSIRPLQLGKANATPF